VEGGRGVFCDSLCNTSGGGQTIKIKTEKSFNNGQPIAIVRRLCIFYIFRLSGGAGEKNVYTYV